MVYIVWMGIFEALFIIAIHWFPGTWAAPGYVTGPAIISGFCLLLFSWVAYRQLRLLGVCGFIICLLTMGLLLMPMA